VNYDKIRYHNIYPGTDLVYYGNQQQIEYDFVVAPGADPDAIKLDFDGASRIRVDEGGDLVLNAGDSEVRQRKAVVYQEVEGRRQEIASRYQLKEGDAVSFEIGAYDRSRPLVIDPVLSYSTFLGRYGYEGVNSIALDEAGNAYITGITNSLDFPTKDPLQAGFGGDYDGFVIKLNPEVSNLIFSTYFGGNARDEGSDIKLDAEGSIFLIGQTYSNNFPTVNAIQPTYAGNGDAFVAKLANDGSALIFSTYLGGANDVTLTAANGADYGESLEVEGSGDICLTGYTSSINFPTVNPFQPVHAPGTYVDPLRIFGSPYFNQDAFVAKLKGDGSALVFSTYLGGTSNEQGQGLAIDVNGDIYVTGNTLSINFPTANSLQSANGGGDAFIVKFDRNGSLIYSTYLGGSFSDSGRAVSLDGEGNVYLVGTTWSSNFPTVSPLYPTLSGNSDIFVVKLNRAGSTIIKSTYLGGTGLESGRGLKIDGQGNVYITGTTQSSDFPTVNAIQNVLNPGKGCSIQLGAPPSDAILVKLDASVSRLAYSSYIGGACGDDPKAIAIDRSGSAYVVGSTASANFPITPGAFQNTFFNPDNTPEGSNYREGFIFKIGN
jgi:beta-propeller repeat-containing protein